MRYSYGLSLSLSHTYTHPHTTHTHAHTHTHTYARTREHAPTYRKHTHRHMHAHTLSLSLPPLLSSLPQCVYWFSLALFISEYVFILWLYIVLVCDANFRRLLASFWLLRHFSAKRLPQFLIK